MDRVRELREFLTAGDSEVLSELLLLDYSTGESLASRCQISHIPGRSVSALYAGAASRQVLTYLDDWNCLREVRLSRDITVFSRKTDQHFCLYGPDAITNGRLKKWR
jgi:hypothetical protein